MREVKEDVALVAACGLYCGACGAYLKERCNGCAANVKASWCKIRTCCQDAKTKTCAECVQVQDPNDCAKFNNVISKIFSLIFRSDRRACVMQIKKAGLGGHARTMTELRRQSLKKGSA